jgi:NTP pyrophosphatase (non-canonical NTP hydrolase)
LVKDPEGGMPRLLEIMARLRDPETGCPWDIEQTFATIAPYTIEEAHEVADAIARQDWDDLRGELGDLLFQVVYHAQMAQEAGHFGFDDVVRAIADKMVARHPHVFGDESRDKTAEQQTADWEAIKAAERGPARVLDGVALGPAGPDARGEAAETRRAGGLRLALDGRGPRQDRRRGARTGRGARHPDRGRDHRGIRRSAVSSWPIWPAT